MKKIIPTDSPLLDSPLLVKEHIKTINDIISVMESHVFAVWDFMSLLKSLQHHLAPTSVPWNPPSDPIGARLINEIVLCEESDTLPGERGNCSHFDLYLMAMNDLGANTSYIKKFIEKVKTSNVKSALEKCKVPIESQKFIQTTFSHIESKKPWVICASFTYGRETIVPKMFKKIRDLNYITINKCQFFDYYLERHIQVDGGDHENVGHGKMSEELLNRLCGEDAIKWQEAKTAAFEAISARRELWDSILKKISRN